MAGDAADPRAPAARVAFITHSPLSERGGALDSDIASVRREALLPARALQAREVATHVVSLAHWPLDEALALARRCDRVVLTKLLRSPHEDGGQPFRAQAAAYRELIARLGASVPLVFCLADDHFDDPVFAAFYRDAAPASYAWVASSHALKERLAAETRCPIHAYPEPVETPRGEARVPRRGARERFGLWFARRTGIGTAAWRLKVLWFGHPVNAGALIEVLPELRALAAQNPLALECVTQPGGELDQYVTPAADLATADFQFALTPWSPKYLAAALRDCDVVILPQRLDDPRRLAKSNNRMVDALHAGRFAVAHAVPSYQELKDFAWVGDSIAEGLRWLLRHPDDALRRLAAGQAHVARHHSLDALADFWLRCLKISA